MTEIQAQVKILELRGYLAEINNIMWKDICSTNISISEESVRKIIETLNEWIENDA